MTAARLKIAWSLVTAAGLVACLVTVRASVLHGMAAWLDVGERPEPAEVVMVLAGGEDHRPFAAAALVRAGYAKKVLLAEIKPSPAVEDGIIPSPQETNRQVLLKRGVPADAITILPGAADTTYEEAQLLAGYLGDKSDVRALVVTTDLHTRRTRMAFRHALGSAAERVSFVAAPIDRFDVDGWWRDQWGFEVIFAEYGKLLFYAACYTHLLAYCIAGIVMILAGCVFYRFRRTGWSCMRTEATIAG